MTYEEIDKKLSDVSDYSVWYACAIHETRRLIKGGNNYWIHWLPEIDKWNQISNRIYREGWVLCENGNTLRKFTYPSTTQQRMFMFRDYAESNGVKFNFSEYKFQ